jgi:hypothetical protein
MRSWVAVAILLTLAVSTASAQSAMDNVQIHGFGGWAYGQTDGNAYLVGSEDGSYDNANFALNITAEPMDKLTVVAQIRGEAVAGADLFELDYAFANYAFSDQFNARIGRVKHPLGIYGEIIDVGTLRPFYYLPQSIYGPNGYTARAYNGVGIAGWHGWDSGWGLEYDVYGGQIEGDFVIPGLLTTVPELFLEPRMNVGFEVNQTIGTRVVVRTPVTGLSFSVSAYRGDDATHLEDLQEAVREVIVGSAEYLDGPWSVRAEYGSLKRGQDFEGQGGYLEVAGRLNQHWQLAARWDTFEVTFPSTDFSTLPPFFSQLLDHQELALGVNYWFGTKLVVRLSYSQVEGDRMAFLASSEDIQELLMTGELESKTNLFVFGAQFSF